MDTTVKFPKLDKKLSPISQHVAETIIFDNTSSGKKKFINKNFGSRRNTMESGSLLLSDYKPA
jgi:hypothetical protein